ncbi:MAG: sigma factor-like helix-turn-helix DNA-binding protein, partial [Candidatus Poribacteria bacterium]|nr:sigma factor-like helix-turn-helix DNA-binding protein [Candidatus Poribacteria bacterium]
LAETVEDTHTIRPDTAAEQSEMRAQVESALSALDERSARVIRLRYGLENGVSHSLTGVGALLQLSRERIRQLEAAAFDRLRHPVRAAQLQAFIQPSA